MIRRVHGCRFRLHSQTENDPPRANSKMCIFWVTAGYPNCRGKHPMGATDVIAAPTLRTSVVSDISEHASLPPGP